MTLLATCSFLAMVPVDPQLKSEAGVVVIGEAGSFIDQLREGAAAPTVIGHWTSLAPPILAVMVALFFRSMIFALLSAFVAGSFCLSGLILW